MVQTNALAIPRLAKLRASARVKKQWGVAVIIAVCIWCGKAYAQEPLLRKTAPRTKTNFAAWPAASYAPETELEIGAAALIVWRPANDTDSYKRASRAAAYAGYTTLGQGVASLELDWFAGKKYYVYGYVSANDFPEYFYPEPRSSARILFDNRYVRFECRAMRVIYPAVFAGVLLTGRSHDVEWSGSRPAAPNLIGREGGKMFGGGVALRVDSRNDVLNPVSGVLFQAEAAHYPPGFGEQSYSFQMIECDFSIYRILQKPGGTLAINLAARSTFGGAPPFFAAYRLGGSGRLRGLHANRVRGGRSTLAQAEYRRPLIGRLGAVVFAGAGGAADLPGYAEGFRAQWGAGAGLRWRVFRSESLNLRLDAAVNGYGGTGVYFGAGEAF